MTATSDTNRNFPIAAPRIRIIRSDRPWFWLAAGWQDFLRAPGASLVYGGVIAGFSAVLVGLLQDLNYFSLLLPALAGFAIVSPILAVGLYGISRALSEGGAPTVRGVCARCRTNLDQIGLMGALLLMIHLSWVRIATLLFALFFAETPVGLPALIGSLLGTPQGFAFLSSGAAIGAVLAALTFAISATSLPMLVDREVDVVTAITTSWSAVTSNIVPMALWAAIIVGATLFGFATYFLGLIVVVPLLGLASWHAYRELVAFEDEAQPDLPHLMPMELR